MSKETLSLLLDLSAIDSPLRKKRRRERNPIQIFGDFAVAVFRSGQ